MTHPDFDGIDTYGKDHKYRVEYILKKINHMHHKKEAEYQGSWARRGFMGVFHNMTRPWDRLDNTFEGTSVYSPNKVVRSSIFDALLDLALYCVKLAVTLVEKDPLLYDKWHNDTFDESDDIEIEKLFFDRPYTELSDE